jgi:hypothetical protein
MIMNEYIQLTSAFLREHFQSDEIPLDVYLSNFESAKRVLNNPKAYPHADMDYFCQLEEELLSIY